MSENDELLEIINEFLVESHENLDLLDIELVSLEQEPDPDTLASIFRTIHTVKGTSGFLGFSVLERLTHVGESLLSKLRDGELEVTESNTSALLWMVDAVRALLTIIQDTGADDGGAPIDELVLELERLQDPRAYVTDAPLGPPLAAASDLLAHPDSGLEPDDDPSPSFGELVVSLGLVGHGDVAAAALRQAAGDPRRIGELLVDAGALRPEAVAEILESQKARSDEAPIRGSTPADSVVRIDVGQLDDLMDLVGQLALARNQIMQFAVASPDPVLKGASQRLNTITTELQAGIMKTRMQPIDQVWSRFPRIVRDLALACDKKVRVEMVGRDIELDRTVLEAIKDPLTHLIRNSVDHGLELPRDRALAGKPEEGVVLLAAYHEGGQVHIEITDDGRGIQHEQIKAKAVENQIFTPAQAEQAMPRDTLNLIFEPGFSTAETVTKVSGRGVGMDVVKTNIGAIGGTIDVETSLGEGTTFRIKIPLTLDITPPPLVERIEQRFPCACRNIPRSTSETSPSVVASAAEATATRSADSNRAANEVASMTEDLGGLVGRFTY